MTQPALSRPRRFQIVRTLGSGGMGVVYEAIDHARKSRVALKTLRTLEAEALLRFKNEFRSLSDIHHPNLVSLGELVEEQGRLFFTMEHVRGVHLMQHVRPRASQAPPRRLPRRRVDHSTVAPGSRRPAPVAAPQLPDGERFDEARLRGAFAQLARGLFALHAMKKVHRDVKPSNVLVTEAGRVVILDFGLILDVGRGEHLDTSVVGTAHYMAPEQAAGRQVGPEADWYSVGAMLYVALTGHYAFQVAPDAALELKQIATPARPSEITAQALPEDLEALCLDLLRLDPAARPTGADVLRRLGAEDELLGDGPRSHLPPPSGFVGRHAELDALRAAMEETQRGASVAVLIEGESGVGKSALVQRFLDERAAGAVVLAGRCYERESVPYKAVDEVVDALSRYLSRLPFEQAVELLPDDAALLADVFPVLKKVSAIVDMPRPSQRPRDPIATRLLLFAALRELLRRIAARGLLVIAIDDLQWADADGMALLGEVLCPPDAPALLLVATIRTGSEASIARVSPRAALPPELCRNILLSRLPDEDAHELVGVLLAGAGGQASIDAGALVEEAGGHPLFIDALVRHHLSQGDFDVPLRLDDALWVRICRLDAPARQLLELVAVAGGPISLQIAGAAAAAELDELTRLAAILRAGSLVRTSGTEADDVLETYHDRIRETMLAHLDPPAKRAWHGRLALSLEGSGDAELEVLAVHWREAGDAERAAAYAVRAGNEATAALAFDRAVRLYRMAIELRPAAGEERRALREKLAEALADAGRGAEAAAAFLGAIPGASPRAAVDLRRRAADCYLRCGYFDEGMACLRDVLAAADMDIPSTPAAALALLLARRAQAKVRGLHFEERPAASIDPEMLRRIDVCWSAALGLAMIDNIRGAYFQTRNLLLSLEAGEPYRVARAIAMEIPFVAIAGGPARERVAELISLAEVLAARAGRIHAVGLVKLVTGTSLYCAGRWRAALAAFDAGEVIFRERCTGAYGERSTTIAMTSWDLWFLGDLREFSRRIPIYLHEAEERGDRYLSAQLRSYLSNARWLIQDDPDAARREADTAIHSWSRAGFHLQHLHDLVARAQIALYEGNAEAAHAGLLDRWPALKKSMSLRLQVVRIYATHLRGRTALACAAGRASRSREELLDMALGSARELEGERMHWSDPLAALLRAGAASIRGDAATAATSLTRASKGFSACEMGLFAAAARRRQGEIEGGAAGRALVEDANRWMHEQGVVNPDRMTAMVAPGFRR